MAAIFVSTFLLPSGLAVIFSTIVVERFLANLEEDLVLLEERWSRAVPRSHSSICTMENSAEAVAKPKPKVSFPAVCLRHVSDPSEVITV